MILLKTVVLFVLANPAEFYPLTEAEKKDCGICSYYLRKSIGGKPVVPVYPKQYPAQLQNNNKVKCGQNIYDELRNANITETKHTKIVNGGNATKNEFPWQVGLANGYGGEIICGGSIISSKEILTAAHCVQAGRYKYSPINGEVFPIQKCIYAVVGEHDKSKTNEGEQWNRICDVKVHKNYKGKVEEKWFFMWTNKNYHEHDIAVLTLCRELQFTDEVAPVCLPQPIALNNKYENKNVIASGWGRLASDSRLPMILQKVTLKTMSNTDCFKKYKLPSSDNHESKICATNGPDNEMDTCQGDSGGPLVFSETDENSNTYFTLIGVTSYGMGCAKKGYPGVYARVTDAMKWINEIEYEGGKKGIQGQTGKHPAPPPAPGPACSTNSNSIELRKDSKNSRSLKNTGGVTYYHFEKDKKLSRKKAQETCISKYGGQLTSINTQDEYDWIKEQVIDLKMFGPIAIGGQWKDKSSRKFEWTDESEMDMSVLNANWFRTRNYQFPSYKNKKRINLELWYSRRALGFANALDHKAPSMYICKVAESCTSCSSCA